MFRVLLFVILFVLFSIFSIGSLKEIRLQEPPQILGGVSGPKQFETGDNFTLECESNRPIHWSYPQLEIGYVDESVEEYEYEERSDKPKSLITVSNSMNSGLFHSIISVNSANFLDTGYYNCIVNGTALINDSNTENVTRAYIYVKGKKRKKSMSIFFVIF
ncbi:hypothetical protein C0J52_18671 [Blattella germanica]|nr:hypothetical protein C0J52_18671 [Blattella germanica]